jgi:hypothetical protein
MRRTLPRYFTLLDLAILAIEERDNDHIQPAARVRRVEQKSSVTFAMGNGLRGSRETKGSRPYI